MTESMDSRDQAVNALLAERARYEEWLRALEQKREQTPDHIYTRVHGDYSARLQRVYEQLGTHRAAVDQMIGELLDRLTMLDIDESKFRDERSEAELRGMIGEFTQDRCEDVIQRCDEGMARIADEKATIGAEIARLRSILEAAPPASREGPPRRASGAEEQIVLEEDSAVELDATPSAETPPEPPPAASGEPMTDWLRPKGESAGFDELEFLRGVVDSAGEGPGQAEEATPEESGQAGSAEHHPPRGETEGSSGRELRESIPSFLRTTPTEQVKTLKCQECGTMNYPTEWYCERCGAELAAL